MVTWLPRESAVTPSRRSISARCWPYWPNSVEASRLSSKASTTWVALVSPAASGEGRSEPLSEPRVRNASALQGCQLGRGGLARQRPRKLAKQAVGAGARDRHGHDLADQRGGRHRLHRLQVGRAADQLPPQAARLLAQHLAGGADARLVEGGLTAVDLGLQAGEALDLGGVVDLVVALGRRRARPRRILEREGARVADLADDRQRRGEILLGLARRPDDEIGREG